MSAVTGGETQQALVAPGVKPPLAVPRRLLRMRSDATLAERFAAGDEAAFDVIYERHRPVVLAVCMGVLGTPADAEDATQETFSALAVALRTRPPAELRPWLIRVARNASIDTTRRRRHRLLTLDGEIPEVAARPHGSGQAELAVVLDGIRELPEGQRMALLMRELGGHSYAEIAEFLATDEEAVKGLIARARVGLRTYREATELSCATARETIAAEPDGRRYDKTIRRHLRSCSSCRGYREALRDDAKALRAALPIQAGTVATGSLSGGGLLSAAKGSLLSYGLTQAATTCAASACAVGAIGGMVFVAPVHKLGLFPILPARSSAPAHRHPAPTKLVQHHAVAATRQASEQTSSTLSQSSARSSVASSATPSATRTATTHRRRPVHVTRVVLPPLPKHHPHAGAPAQTAVAPASDQGQSAVNQTTASTAQNPGGGNAGQGPGNGNGNAYGSWKTAAQNSVPQASPATSPASSTQSSPAPSPQFSSVPSPAGQTLPGNGNHGQGNGHGRWGDNPHSGNPQGATASAAAAAPSQAPTPPATTTATATTATSALPATTTAATSATTPAPGWGGPGHGHGWGNGHGNWSQSAPAQPAATAPAGPVSTTAATTTTSTTAAGWSGNGWGGNGHGWGHSR